MNADSADPTTFDCTTCGACCASFRVSFYWAEGAANGLPENLTERLNDRFSCMAGTNSSAPRCVALQGRIGEARLEEWLATRPMVTCPDPAESLRMRLEPLETPQP